MTKLLVVGATGGTGRHLVAQALEAGHEVTAYVRDPGKLQVTHERLRVVVGTIAEDAAPFLEAMKDQQAVISTLGRGPSLQSDQLIQRCVPAMLSAMKAGGVGRLIFTSAIGVGDAYSEAPLLSKMVIRVILKDIYPDKLIGENLIRNSHLDWTIVQPAGLTNGRLTRRYRAGEHLHHRMFATISRPDLADFLVSQLDDRRYVHRIVQLEY